MDDVPELEKPFVAKYAESAKEIARVWIVDGKQQVALTRELWNDPAAWGLILVDVAREIAKAYEGEGRDGAEVLARIRAGLDAEWAAPTELPE